VELPSAPCSSHPIDNTEAKTNPTAINNAITVGCAVRRVAGKTSTEMMPTVRRAVGPGAIVLLLVASMAMAQAPLALRGTIENVGGQTLVVKEQDGKMSNARLADDVHVFTLKKASLANVKQGSVVGLTTRQQMDDSPKAVEIYIFPDQPRHQPGARAKVISESEVLEYIDGSVLSVQDATLVIKREEGEKKITMLADVRVVMLVSATVADIKVGQYFFIPDSTPTSLSTLASTIVVGSDHIDFAM
jgi:hypothetical protein